MLENSVLFEIRGEHGSFQEAKEYIEYVAFTLDRLPYSRCVINEILVVIKIVRHWSLIYAILLSMHNYHLFKKSISN